MRKNLKTSARQLQYNTMGIIIIGIIATLLLIYLFATMIYPEKF